MKNLIQIVPSLEINKKYFPFKNLSLLVVKKTPIVKRGAMPLLDFNRCETKLMLKIQEIIRSDKDIIQKLGTVKGHIHNKFKDSVNPVFIESAINYLLESGIKYHSIRDQRRMWAYRKENTICEICKTNKSKHTHHILSPGKGGQEVYNNYMAVCIPCHIELHPELPKGFIH